MANEVAIAPTQPTMITIPASESCLELLAPAAIQPASVIALHTIPRAIHWPERARTPARIGAQAPSPSGINEIHGHRGRSSWPRRSAAIEPPPQGDQPVAEVRAGGDVQRGDAERLGHAGKPRVDGRPGG